MAAAWQTVRVFISSTFRDMHAERDYLVKVVFPSLREKLEKYRIHLVDIDLRWGITEEEAQRDRVLDLCLEQIDECRPFFVGILGERYGWVPGSFSEEALSKYGWVQHQTGKSVTELEVLYGVLRDPEMHARALFLFRDPAFIAKVPEAKRADMMAEDDESAEKLRRLKQAIRDASLSIPVLENYPCRYAGLRIDWRLARRELDDAAQEALEGVAADGIVDPGEYGALDDQLCPVVDRLGVVHLTGLKTFGLYVGEQLWRAIQAEHHLPDVPPVETGAAADPLAIEQDYHERFMESRLRVYVGRENIQERLTAFTDGDATHPCLVTAPSGSGKSAALAKFATSYAQTHPDVLVIPHFVGASPGSTGLRQMLRRFCLVLKDRFGLAEEVPLDVNALVARFRGSLESVPGDGRVVLVIDALNRLDETDNAHSMYWLPWELPPGVKIIASSIDDPDRTEPVLEALSHRPVERVPVEPLTDDERREIIRQVPSLSAKTLDRRQVDLLLANPATKNPLFLLVALEELRGFGSFEQLEVRIAAFPHEGDTVTAVFGQVIERLREEFDADVVRTVLALLACARSGMSERELLEMVEPEKGTGLICAKHPAGRSGKLDLSPFPESTSDLFPVLRQLRPYLQHRGEMVDFFHRGLYKAVRERYLDESSVRSYHQNLAQYFRAKLNPPGAEAWSGDYPRALSELPHHQTQGRLWEPLEATLTALPFLEGKVTAGMTFELASDFTAAVEALPADRPQRRILKLMDEALRRDIHFIARHAQDYLQALFQCLWNTCWWYDCEEAAAHYESGRPPGLPSPTRGSSVAGGSTTPPLALGGDSWRESSQPPSLQPDDHRLSTLLERWRQSKEHSCPGFAWLASRRPPPMHLGTAQRAVFRGHEKLVRSVAFSPDGNWIASASGDCTVRIWDAASGAELVVLRGHEGEVHSVAFSSGRDRIASGSGSYVRTERSDDTIRVWDAASGAELAVLRGHEDRVNSVAFSPDGHRIASASSDKTVRVWDAASWDELAVLRGHEFDVTSVSYSPDGQQIASGSQDRTVRVWDAESGAELAVLQGHKNIVFSVSFSPNGDRIASGCGGSFGADTLRVWDARTGTELAVLPHESWVTSVCFSPDGHRIASGSWDNTVRVWDAASGAELTVLRGHEDRVHTVAFSPDGHQIASGSSDRTVRLWETQSGAELAVLRGDKKFVSKVVFSPAGDRIASESDNVLLWDAATGAELAVLYGHEWPVESLAFSPSGDRIACLRLDHKNVQLFDAATGAELATLRGHERRVNSVAFSFGGDRIASGSGDNTVRVWDAASGRELAVMRGHEEDVTSVAFSPDGRRIASGSWDNTVRVWDSSSGGELAVLCGHEDSVYSVAFSPGGDRLASGAGDNTVRVWDAASGAELAVLRGHAATVRSVAFSVDGDRIVSWSRGVFSAKENDTLRVWGLGTGECLEVFQGTPDVQAIASAPTNFPLRAIPLASCGQETLVEQAEGSRPVAFFPISLDYIATHPNGRSWAGSVHSHVYIITLEGEPPAPPAKPSEQE